MDYKEKYEMALEGIQEILSSGEDSIKMSRLQMRLQGIFPELKESEGEGIRKELISLFQDGIDGVNHRYNGSDCRRWIAWLERQGEQKPAWSKEDKRKMDRIYSILRQAADTHAFSTSCRLIGDAECIELQDFLKHLKDRVGCEANCTTMWKPSDAQMKRLKEACDEHYEIDGLDPLYTLYEDLKKLREE